MAESLRPPPSRLIAVEILEFKKKVIFSLMARPLREELAASLVNVGKTADFRTIDYRTFTSKEHQIEREREISK